MKRRLPVSAVLSALLLAALDADVDAADAEINASDGAVDDYFGASVAISGDYAIVGAYEDKDVAYPARIVQNQISHRQRLHDQRHS